MRIAIIGSGISGLTVASELWQTADVTVFEAAPHIGGHTHTIDVELGGRHYAVDTGFIVFNDRTYPNFVSMLDRLGVPSQPAPMTFSVRCDQTDLEYRGADLNGLFAQRRNILRPRFYRLLAGLLRFNKAAAQLIKSGDDKQTVRQYFAEHRFPDEFYHKYFLPMGSAIWSCPQTTFEDFPIRFIAEFYRHHGLLGVKDRPQWRVVQGGSRRYVERLVAPFRSRIRLNTPVRSVSRNANRVTVRTDGQNHEFDHVVFACHADQALQVLGEEATAHERDILAAFPYETNDTVLHTDDSILPRRRRAWASWNYFIPATQNDKASLTYCMNILQGLQANDTFCVTLNNTERIDPARIIRRIKYSHPIFDTRRKAMQARHAEVIGRNRRSFCGAYWGNGFHEDGIVSALAVLGYFRKHQYHAQLPLSGTRVASAV